MPIVCAGAVGARISYSTELEGSSRGVEIAGAASKVVARWNGWIGVRTSYVGPRGTRRLACDGVVVPEISTRGVGPCDIRASLFPNHHGVRRTAARGALVGKRSR